MHGWRQTNRKSFWPIRAFHDQIRPSSFVIGRFIFFFKAGVFWKNTWSIMIWTQDRKVKKRFNVVSPSGHMKPGAIGNCRAKRPKRLCMLYEWNHYHLPFRMWRIWGTIKSTKKFCIKHFCTRREFVNLLL